MTGAQRRYAAALLAVAATLGPAPAFAGPVLRPPGEVTQIAQDGTPVSQSPAAPPPGADAVDGVLLRLVLPAMEPPPPQQSADRARLFGAPDSESLLFLRTAAAAGAPRHPPVPAIPPSSHAADHVLPAPPVAGGATGGPRLVDVATRAPVRVIPNPEPSSVALFAAGLAAAAWAARRRRRAATR